VKVSSRVCIILAALVFSASFSAASSASAADLEIMTKHGPVDFPVSDLVTPAQLDKLKLDLTSLVALDLPAARSAVSIEIFGTTTTNYFDWFAARVKSFGMDLSSPASASGNTYTYTAASYQSDQSILLDDYFLEPSSAVRMGTLIHEARHGDGVHHVTCSRTIYPHLQASLVNMAGACDADEKGAYGAQFIFELDLLSRNPQPNSENSALADDLAETSGRFLSATSRAILGAQYNRVRHTEHFLAALPW
jgi:hypothetical protein